MTRLPSRSTATDNCPVHGARAHEVSIRNKQICTCILPEPTPPTRTSALPTHCEAHDEFDPRCAECQRSPGIAASRHAAAWYGKVDTTLFGWYRHADYANALQLTMVREDHVLVLEGRDGRDKVSVLVPDDEWAEGAWKRAF